MGLGLMLHPQQLATAGERVVCLAMLPPRLFNYVMVCLSRQVDGWMSELTGPPGR